MLSKPIITSILVWSLILLGSLLRAYKADAYPTDNNDDGLYYVWVGNSFLDNPTQVTSHTIFDQNNSALIWRSQYMDFEPVQRFGFKLARPWYDHPPFAAILISLPARLLGYKNFEQIPHLIVRFPALVASIFTLYLTYALTKILFDQKTAFFSLIIIATTPYFVIAHHQSFLENILTPIFLLSLLMIIKYQQSKQGKYLIIAIVTSFLTGWCKVIGFGLPLLLAGWSWWQNSKKASIYLLINGFLSLLSYFAYGMITNRQFFLQTIFNQGDRGAFFESLLHSMTFLHFYAAFNDGWYLLAMIFSLAILIKMKKTENEKTLSWFILGFMMLLFFLSGKTNNSPWYRFPLIPLLTISLSIYTKTFWEKFSPFLTVPFFLLGFTGTELIHLNISSAFIRLFTLIIFVPLIFAFILQNKYFKKLGLWLQRVLLISMILLNIVTVIKYPTVYCQQNVCLKPQKIVLPSYGK
ncbi:hypothetical protein COX08_02910 [Candidatus Beckwithbacteria bacterium CG23_combo_of_CG06-09_8_20_14_all_34_8]|uniref:Glycosyltransferase RgtA/B/C/D-like domain-containing protein n=1 Tax=Candidatus Beckwithbacteria bacterium CG23_combo_of_CG06-09_8_20_14_all_34_8 TaxID=1974497 RepID=A0A2H0B833_9BACT|nr:MAG: hypothetical protein COX08_02910 [Candidatus Beckwithbacteria bacterium CG23_combo_of_CG06-09_8_20_14_all_34_8]